MSPSLSGVRKVCWRPLCQDCTAPSLSCTHTLSYRGSRPRLRPPLHLLRLLLSTSIFPLHLQPPRRHTPLLRANRGSWRSTQRQPIRQTPPQLCPPIPIHCRRLFIPTPTCHRRDRGSSLALSQFQGCSCGWYWRNSQSKNATGMLWRHMRSFPSFLYLLFSIEVCKHSSNGDIKDMQ